MASCICVMKKYMSTTPAVKGVFKHVTIVGGGLMGSGIAQVTAQSGMDVTVVELSEDAMKKSDANIKGNIQRVAKKLFQNRPDDAEKYISESIGRLKISLDLNEAVAKSDLVVEAIVENIGAKHKLFSKIDGIAPEHTIFASNTSSLPIKEIASVTNRKDRFGGLHFFNPVPVMKLLEVIRTDDTSEDTFQKMLSWGKAIGKTTVTCKDTPGFVVNRLLIPYLAEAARMLERGDASAKDIDTAMKLGAGYPMGPLELLDYVGLDTTKFILDGWHKKDPNNLLFKPISIIDKLVSEGKLGKKTGEGFYNYKKNYGNPSYVLYSPYFEPLPVPQTAENAQTGQKALIPHLMPRMEKFKRKKVENEPEINSNLAKMERAEKLKKLDKLKVSLAGNKTTQEDSKSERDRSLPGDRRQSTPKRLKSFGNFTTYDIFKAEEKAKNLEDFMRFERNKGLLLERN